MTQLISFKIQVEAFPKLTQVGIFLKHVVEFLLCRIKGVLPFFRPGQHRLNGELVIPEGGFEEGCQVRLDVPVELLELG